MTLDLDLPAVRACADALSDTGAQVVAGSTRAPAAETVPCWATSDAAAALSGSIGRQVAVIGAEVGSAGRQISAATDDYEDADLRAAQRLRNTLWR